MCNSNRCFIRLDALLGNVRCKFIYYDRKALEIRQCCEYRSIQGAFRVLLSYILDLLKFWFSCTVFASWVLAGSIYNADDFKFVHGSCKGKVRVFD